VDLVKAVGGGWDASKLPSSDALRSTAMNSPKSNSNLASAAGK
jgi:hypothetical protein